MHVLLLPFIRKNKHCFLVYSLLHAELKRFLCGSISINLSHLHSIHAKSLDSIVKCSLYFQSKSYGICLSFIDFFSFHFHLFLFSSYSFYASIIRYLVLHKKMISYLWLFRSNCMLNLVAIDNYK